MIVWCISNHADLSGRGGLIAQGRWHRKGIPVVYCSDHPSTTLLEIVVQVDIGEMPENFQLLKIHCPDNLPLVDLSTEQFDPDDLQSTRARQRTAGECRNLSHQGAFDNHAAGVQYSHQSEPSARGRYHH